MEEDLPASGLHGLLKLIRQEIVLYVSGLKFLSRRLASSISNDCAIQRITIVGTPARLACVVAKADPGHLGVLLAVTAANWSSLPPPSDAESLLCLRLLSCELRPAPYSGDWPPTVEWLQPAVIASSWFHNWSQLLQTAEVPPTGSAACPRAAGCYEEESKSGVLISLSALFPVASTGTLQRKSVGRLP